MTDLFFHTRAWVVVLFLSVAAGCGGGASSSGTAEIHGRRCGNGEPCSAGAKCSLNGIESGYDCDCDASGHFFCDPYSGGGAPPGNVCSPFSACGQGGAGGEGTGGGGTGGAGTCSESNGYCTRTCQCNGTCTDKCDGMGPPEGYQGAVCDKTYCASVTTNEFASCSVSDGTCDYKVECNGTTANVTGSCP
jgi:hypothetical protein